MLLLFLLVVNEGVLSLAKQQQKLGEDQSDTPAEGSIAIKSKENE